jgi:negative regulator of flagellin synthesis FlgM
MKIYGNNEPVSRIEKLQKGYKPSSKSVQKTDATPAVEISNIASELAGLQEVLKNTPEVRMERVSQLKADIEQGNYKIDDEKLADVLSRFMP